MNATRFIAELLRKGIILWVENGDLCFRAPQDVMTPSLRQELSEHKAEVIILLGANKKYSPCSFAQQRLWFLDQIEGEHADTWLIPIALRLTGKLHAHALRHALQEIVHRHETLHTAFTAMDGEAVQSVVPERNLLLTVIDLSRLPAEERERETRRCIREDARTGFDLSRSPLIRFGLLKLDAKEHVLLVNMHHIVSDGWSISVLVREFTTLYVAEMQGRGNPLPPLPIQYADYAVWQRSWLTGDVLQGQIDYWRRQLADLPPLLTLPTDFSRPAIQTFAGQHHAFSIDSELTKRLKALGQTNGATLFMTLLGVFGILLGRYAGQTDLAVGTPIANRTRQELEGLIGFFANILVLRIDLQGNPIFTNLLERIKKTCLDAYAHQDVALGLVVDELKPERTLSYNQLFQVMFILQNTPDKSLQLPGLSIAPLETEELASKFDLTLEIAEEEGVLYGSWEYNTDLFRSETITRMHSHFLVLLKGIVSNPDLPMNMLPMMTETERKQVLETFNAGRADYSLDRCAHYLFEEQATRTPGAPALAYLEQVLTYDALNGKANRLAHHLRSLGVGPDMPVGICVERSPEMVIALLAVLKAGGAYVPMDPNYPQDRITYMLEDCKARILLTHSNQSPVAGHQSSGGSSAPDVSTSALKIVFLDKDWETISAQPSHNPKVEMQPGNLAYVIYTSGTTGKPKGVMIRHQNLVNAYFGWEQVYELREIRSHLQMANFAFDVFSGDLMRALCSGGKLILCPRDYLLAPDRLYELMQREQVECAEFVPAVLKELVRHLEESGRSLDFMRLLICGSDVLHGDEYARFLRFCGSATRLLNTYGLTEAAIDSSYFETRSPDRLCPGKAVPIGRPFPNTRFYVLDHGLRPLPIGVPGELYVGGQGVAAGYWERTDLTAEKFIPDPFSADPQARLYRTGDLARWLQDGNIEYLGRSDFQVKIRGFRIELGEIEAALTRHAQVREALVLAREDTPGNKRLVAYIVPGRNTHSENSSLNPENASLAHLDQWQSVYDGLYADSGKNADPTLDLSGWNSSYTGKPIPTEEMQEWIKHTVDRILDLQPKRILEIGCGAGLLLYRIAPRCEAYAGSDLSKKILLILSEQMKQREWEHVRLFHGPADDLSIFHSFRFDVAVLNSLIQHFPDGNYLRKVLDGLISLIDEGGRIFIGDVRNLALLDAFYWDVLQVTHGESLPPLEQRRHMDRIRMMESELIVDPAFFLEMKQRHPRVRHVSLYHKRGEYHNELTKFRYDVVLHLDSVEAMPSDSIDWLDWVGQASVFERLKEILADPQYDRIGVRKVPNARVFRAVGASRLFRSQHCPSTIDAFRRELERDAQYTVDPETFWRLAEDFGWTVDIGLNDAEPEFLMDAIFQRHPHSRDHSMVCMPISEKTVPPGHSSSEYTNDPAWGTCIARLPQDLRTLLQQNLPDYMVPMAFVMLDALPLTPNGKVDRKALPAPEYQTPVETYVAPRTPVEETLAAIFSEVLGVERVSITDSFFELGGHSLLAITLLERMRHEGLHVDLRALFTTPTIAGLAAAVMDEASRVEVPPNLIPVRCEAITPEMLTLVKLSQPEIDSIIAGVQGGAANVQDIYPLAPLQEGILFHYLMSSESEGDAYLLGSLFRFDTRPRLEMFLEALQKVIDRHDMLRTAIMWEGLSDPVQVVWRRAILENEEVTLDPAAGDAAGQLRKRFDLRHTRLDVRRAPLLRTYTAYDPARECWLLLVLLHHLMGDHTTLGMIEEEVQAYLLGQSNCLPKPLPFRNFVAQARLGTTREEHQQFFQQMLGDVDEPTAPFGLLDVRGDGTGIEETFLEVDPPLARRLRERAQALKISVATLAHQAWALVLARLSGREDVVFGTVLFGRMQGGEGADRVMGMFINTLPMRIRIGEEGTEASVRRTYALLTELMRHEHAPLALAQRCSGVPAPTPLFSALLNCRHIRSAANPASASDAVQAWEGVEQFYGEERTNYPFALAVDDWDSGIHLTAQVQAPIEPVRVVGFMHTALERLVKALEQAPKSPIRWLDILPEVERMQVIEGFNQTRVDYPKDCCVHQLFEDQAKRTPESIALVLEGQALTYHCLNRRANQLAHHLRALGLGPDALVGICVERSPEMLIGLLGILKAGGAYVPIDPSYPQKRIAFMLEDARAQILLTQSALTSSFVPHPASFKVVFLDTDREALADQRLDNLKAAVHAGNLVYIIYTSGSSGRPKGVAVRHENVVAFLHGFEQMAPAIEQRSGTMVASFGFDVSVWEIFSVLLFGGVLHLIQQDLLTEPDSFTEYLVNAQISSAYIPPGLLFELIKSLEAFKNNINLDLILVGVEPISQYLLERYKRLSERLRIINGYGPTETTIGATFFNFLSAVDPKRRTPIGRAAAGYQIYLLDRYLRPVPIGVAGELHIGGVGVTRGYLNRPDLTAEKFIPDSFSAEPGARVYRTGDLGHWLAEGNIEYLGRTDFQVKVRGFRIELGEIETALTRQAQVQEAIVLVREDRPGDKRLIAYVVPADGSTPEIADLRTNLKASLPDYMIPSAFVMLESLPLTANGKIDRKALPAPEYQASVEAYVAPRNPTEEALSEIFSEVLGIARVGMNDNFFNLGGHSLLLIQVIAQIQQKMKIDLPLTAIFEAGNVEALARRLDGSRNSDSWSPLVCLRPGADSETPIFCFPGAGGLITHFLPLSRNLNKKVPLYVLLPRGVNGGVAPHRSVEEMAHEHMTRIREIRPDGPYRLMGHSFGGWVAFEVARKLAAENRPVEPVLLLDSMTPHEDGKGHLDLETRHVIVEYASYIEEATGQPLRLSPARLEGLSEDEQLLLLMEDLERTKILPMYSLKLVKGLVQVYTANANMTYAPIKPYQGKVWLIQAEESPAYSEGNGIGWSRFAPQLQVERVPGGHETMLQEPNVEALIDIIRKVWVQKS